MLPEADTGSGKPANQKRQVEKVYRRRGESPAAGDRQPVVLSPPRDLVVGNHAGIDGPTEPPVAYERLDRHRVRHEPHVESDREEPAGAACRLDHRHAFGGVHRQRLLAQHVRAPAERRESHRRVVHRHGADRDEIEALGVEHRAVVRVRAGDAILLRQGPGTIRIDVRHRNEFGPRQPAEHVDMQPPLKPAADDADSHHHPLLVTRDRG